MKAIIITINSVNYGNRLQNLAVQRTLEKLGLDAVTLVTRKKYVSGKMYLKYGIFKMSGFLLSKNSNYWEHDIPRYMAFDRFNRQNVHCMVAHDKDRLPPADFYVLGSDQVLNPNWYSEQNDRKNIFLLTQVQTEKKVCFSPSFGIDALPREWDDWFTKYLNDIPYISVREEAGARIVKNLTGRSADVLIDPTMMLSHEEWLAIATQPKKVDLSQPYILAYFLGGRSDRVKRDIVNYAEKIGARIYNLLDYEQGDVFCVDPGEFIYMIEKASLIATDSFHASVFSFLFRKPFLTYSREGANNNMMSRMETFLRKFDLERKYVYNGIPNKLLENDYETGMAVLRDERKKVFSFLKKSMSLL